MQQNNVGPSQDPYGDDIYTEPDGEFDTLAMLGPLRSMAGTWEGTSGTDVHPVVQGVESEDYFERYVLEPIDRQINGPQLFLASGHVDADAKQFELTATLGSLAYGILSNVFLDRAFRTTHYRIVVNVEDQHSWSYEQETLLELPGQTTPFSHTDRNRLHRIAAPVPNPMSAAGTQGPAVSQ